VARHRARWRQHQQRINPSRLIFIDETSAKTNMAPLRGWAPRGQRLKAKAPYGHWNTMTFIAALRCDRVEAPWLIDRPINGDRFQLYVEKVLLPTLREHDIVVADNLASHRRKAIRRIIRSVGARLIFLPKYSPDLNPIEQFFAKLKHWLRKAGKRSVEAVTTAIGGILDTVTSDECRNYFRNSGYGSV
jgi:transposase